MHSRNVLSEVISQPLRILIVGAHPADIFDQTGGTMAHHTDRGDWVGCVVLTHGVRVHDKVICHDMLLVDKVPEKEELLALMAERADVKAQEVLQACNILGVEDVYLLGADDAVLLANDQNVRQLAKLIRRTRPNIIITQFPKEDGGIGSPHSVAGQITMMAVSLAAGVDPGDTTSPHRVAQVFYMGIGATRARSSVWASEGGYYSDVLIDITDVIGRKLQALDCLKSQGYDGLYARKRIETSDGAFGNEALVPYAEGFISWRASKHYYLPLTRIELDHSLEADHDITIRMSYRYDDTCIESAQK